MVRDIRFSVVWDTLNFSGFYDIWSTYIVMFRINTAYMIPQNFTITKLFWIVAH